MGINTGQVVVGVIGDNLRMDYTAVGDTTNLAARLQQNAAPGKIVISDSTYRLVEGYCQAVSLGKIYLKGKKDPVSVRELDRMKGRKTRIEVEEEKGLTPFVGRDKELQLLLESFNRAQKGEYQAVFITGEPGIGKSRLLFELRRHLNSETGWYEGNSVSFGQSIAFYPLIDMLKRKFHIEEGDPESGAFPIFCKKPLALSLQTAIMFL